MNQKNNHREIGSKAETIACDYIKSIGYKIEKRNFHFGRIGEIDIIAKDGDILVFIEVKARSSDKYGSPLESITPKKQFQIKKVADGYYYINKLHEQESRYDVITVNLKKSPPEIEHFKEAFY